jgi:hypothetical protein
MRRAAEDVPPSERMRLLERRAQAIRSRFLRAVDALDERRHQVVAAGNYAKGIAKPAALSVLGIAVLVGVGALAVKLTLRARRERSLSGRASRLLQRLELVPKPSVGLRIFEKAVVSILTIAANEVMRQMTKGYGVGRFPTKRLEEGAAHEAH